MQYIVEKQGITNTKFIIVGRGPHLEEMINLIKEMRLLKYVHKKKSNGLDWAKRILEELNRNRQTVNLKKPYECVEGRKRR